MRRWICRGGGGSSSGQALRAARRAAAGGASTWSAGRWCGRCCSSWGRERAAAAAAGRPPPGGGRRVVADPAGGSADGVRSRWSRGAEVGAAGQDERSFQAWARAAARRMRQSAACRRSWRTGVAAVAGGRPRAGGSSGGARTRGRRADGVTVALSAEQTQALLQEVPRGVSDADQRGAADGAGAERWRGGRGASGAGRSGRARARGAVDGGGSVAHGGLVHERVSGACWSWSGKREAGEALKGVKEQLRADPATGGGVRGAAVPGEDAEATPGCPGRGELQLPGAARPGVSTERSGLRLRGSQRASQSLGARGASAGDRWCGGRGTAAAAAGLQQGVHEEATIRALADEFCGAAAGADRALSARAKGVTRPRTSRWHGCRRAQLDGWWRRWGGPEGSRIFTRSPRCSRAVVPRLYAPLHGLCDDGELAAQGAARRGGVRGGVAQVVSPPRDLAHGVCGPGAGGAAAGGAAGGVAEARARIGGMRSHSSAGIGGSWSPSGVRGLILRSRR